MRPVSDWPEQGPFVGRTAVMRFIEQLRETWDVDTMKTIGMTDVADGVVVRFVWHGAGHGPEANLEMTDLLTVRKRRICGHEFFWDHAEAVEAAGLRE
jgi:ketosteroid isomerase-like protein